jgi:hypothetical protein
MQGLQARVLVLHMHGHFGLWQMRQHTKMLYPLVLGAYIEVRASLGSLSLPIVAMTCRAGGGTILDWSA